MTKKIITSYIAFICMAMMLAMAGVTIVEASEVTGTLSSDASSSDGKPTGNLQGTVSGGGGGSSSGGSSSGGGSGSSNSPSGSVLGASSLDNTQTPGFPKAGVTQGAGHTDQSLWLRLMTLLRNIVSF